MIKDQLLIPVYLNQRIVFDLIAMLQGGISTVTTMTKSEISKENSAEKIRASFGLSNVLSALLKIDLSGEKSNISGTDFSKQTSDERVHTSASLFYTLRNILFEKKMVIEDAESVKMKPGDLIEFKASLTRNPIIETMEAMAELMELAIIFYRSSKRRERKTER